MVFLSAIRRQLDLNQAFLRPPIRKAKGFISELDWLGSAGMFFNTLTVC